MTLQVMVPDTMMVPEYILSSFFFIMLVDSPVIMDSSTSHKSLVMTVASTIACSPCFKTMISSITISFSSICIFLPSLITVTLSWMVSFSLSIIIFEVISWWIAMIVLITMTKMNNRLVYSPVNITRMAKKMLIRLNKVNMLLIIMFFMVFE